MVISENTSEIAKNLLGDLTCLNCYFFHRTAKTCGNTHKSVPEIMTCIHWDGHWPAKDLNMLDEEEMRVLGGK